MGHEDRCVATEARTAFWQWIFRGLLSRWQAVGVHGKVTTDTQSQIRSRFMGYADLEVAETLHTNNHSYAVAFMPGDKTLVIGGNYSSILWNVHTGSQRVLAGCQADALAPDGKIAASVTRNGGRLWDMESGAQLREWRTGLANGEEGRDVVFSPDGKMLAGLHDHTVRIWDVNKLK